LYCVYMCIFCDLYLVPVFSLLFVCP